MDIPVEASMVPSHLSSVTKRWAFARVVQWLCLPKNLKNHICSEMVFDPSESEIDSNAFTNQDWYYFIHSSLGKETKELLSPDLPAPLSKRFTSRCLLMT